MFLRPGFLHPQEWQGEKERLWRDTWGTGWRDNGRIKTKSLDTAQHYFKNKKLCWIKLTRILEKKTVVVTSNKLEEQLTEAQDQLFTRRGQYKNNIARLRADLKAAREEIEMLKRIRNKLNSKNGVAYADIIGLKAENATLKEKIEELEHDKETDEILDAMKDGPGIRG